MALIWFVCFLARSNSDSELSPRTQINQSGRQGIYNDNSSVPHASPITSNHFAKLRAHRVYSLLACYCWRRPQRGILRRTEREAILIPQRESFTITLQLSGHINKPCVNVKSSSSGSGGGGGTDANTTNTHERDRVRIVRPQKRK